MDALPRIELCIHISQLIRSRISRRDPSGVGWNEEAPTIPLFPPKARPKAMTSDRHMPDVRGRDFRVRFLSRTPVFAPQQHFLDSFRIASSEC